MSDVKLLDWEGTPAALVTDGDKLRAFVLKSGAWEDMDASTFESAAANGAILSPEDFSKTFGNAPPLPTSDAKRE